jgi:hypothetical protein
MGDIGLRPAILSSWRSSKRGTNTLAALLALAFAACGTNSGTSSVVDGGVAESFPCATGNDCSAPTNPCEVALCVAGVCRATAAPAGTRVPDSMQVKGDCKRLACGSGGAIAASSDATDIPADDGDPCTREACEGPNPMVQVDAACGGPAADAGARDAGAGDGGARDAGGRDAGAGEAGADDGGAVSSPAGACDKIDILFVIDDSGSMSEEQQNLASNFPRFAQAIDAFRNASGRALDYRLAVTTSGITHTMTLSSPTPPGFPFPIPPRTISERGLDGALVLKSECGMVRRWFTKGDPNLASNFACAARVGTGGPSFEMPLESLKRAVVDRVQDGTNAGFLRDDALLAVVFLTDEDDCSTSLASFEAEGDTCVPPPPGLVPVANFLRVLDDAKGGGPTARTRWAAAVIAGPNDCSSSFGSARAATRMLEFVRQSGSNAVFSSICAGDLSGGLTQALGTMQAVCNQFRPSP